MEERPDYLEAILAFLNSKYQLCWGDGPEPRPSLPNTCLQRLREIIKFREVPQKEIILRPGEICGELRLILKGLLRCYYLKEPGQIDVTLWLYAEQEVVVSVNSYYQQRPGRCYIQAIEDSVLAYITFEEEQQLYRDFVEFNVVGRILEAKYVQDYERQLENIKCLSAMERYVQLRDEAPGLVQRVPGMYLATYLDMHPDSLSRVRRQLSN
jgi:CRP/FNR family transcriptional regulator, anaerobic regulatory protein